MAWWVVRRGLRPIDSMIETAGAIAAGDLTRLEAAFDERTASEERLNRFAADASHELRTPLTAIRGSAELHRKGGLTEVGELEVRDDGPGIPPEHLDKVFERFDRGDPSRARATGGTGLGLSIVAALVGAHGGTARAANGPGGGAVLTVRLPVA